MTVNNDNKKNFAGLVRLKTHDLLSYKIKEALPPNRFLNIPSGLSYSAGTQWMLLRLRGADPLKLIVFCLLFTVGFGAFGSSGLTVVCANNRKMGHPTCSLLAGLDIA